MRPTLFPLIALGLLGIPACANTPVDAVVQLSGAEAGAAAQAGAGTESVAAGGGAAGTEAGGAIGGQAGEAAAGPAVPIMIPDAGNPAPCDPLATIQDGVYRLILASVNECLTSAAATTVNELPAFETGMTPDCQAEGTSFRLEQSSTSEAYEVRNVVTDFNLDVRETLTQSGTPLVLFGPHRLENQRFVFRERTASVFEMSSGNAPDKCVTRRPTGVQIWPCSETDADQAWSVLEANCQ